MDPISVAARRGSFVESTHLVHAVAVQDGAVVAEAGDSALVTSLRSSAKPFQALPLARSRDDLTEIDLAIASASHRAAPEQIEAVRALLAKAEATEEDLECGLQEGRQQERVFHNCSGKHAGMLAACRANGWPTSGYRLPDHPLHQEIRADLAALAQVDAADLATGTDGCGVVAFALPLERVAFMFSRFASLESGDRIATAMRAHPRLIGGEGAPDTELMEQLPGWIAKVGAEGLFCAAGPNGLGVAVKVADGAMRAQRPALAEFLQRLGVALDSFDRVSVDNSLGEVVGEVAQS